jgi:hypothetical protein
VSTAPEAVWPRQRLVAVRAGLRSSWGRLASVGGRGLLGEVIVGQRGDDEDARGPGLVEAAVGPLRRPRIRLQAAQIIVDGVPPVARLVRVVELALADDLLRDP